MFAARTRSTRRPLSGLARGVCAAGLALSFGLPIAPASAQPSSATPNTGVQTLSANQVDLEVVQFGVGDVCRPGELVGVQVALQDRTTKVRELILRMSLPDADGDTAWSDVSIAANPGQKQRVWVYGRLPFFITANPVVLFQAIDPTDGRVVGSLQATIRPGNLAPAWNGLMGMVGRYTVGLERYLVRTTGGLACSPLGHEVTHAIAQLRPGAKGADGELPDRWYGLNQFSCLVWTASGADGEPIDLTPSQAEALVEWVKRGGHLVVVMPGAGQTWLGARDTLLAEILPRVSVGRIDNADLDSLRPLLVGDEPRPRPLPAGQILQYFTLDPRAEAREATPIFTDADGRCVVVRRNAGIGAVTLIGIDLTSRQFLAAGGPEPGVFWHRVLGRRGPLPSQADLQALTASRATLPMDSRSPIALDGLITWSVSKSQTAAVGLLLAFIVFVVYWILAGPLGFAVLKRGQRTQHAWLGFVGVGALFTAIAWGGATAIRPIKISAAHLTFLDHVYGEDTQRARSFVSVLLPSYGDLNVAVPDDGGRYKSSLTAWDEPRDANVAEPSSFPDARGYSIDGRQPSSATVPARATTKTFQIDWAGGPRWKMPAPVRESAPGEFQVGGTLTINRAADKEPLVSGILVHDLPGPLADVVVVVVRGQELGLDVDGSIDRQNATLRSTGSLPSRVDAYRVSAATAWAPGQPLDLAQITARSDEARRIADANFFSGLLPGPRAYGFSDEQQADDFASSFGNNVYAMTFFPMLAPPSFTTNNWSAPPTLARRRATHGLDLGRWFTQPCVIVVGLLGGPAATGTCPVPLSVDGLDPAEMGTRTTGITVVRWVYPLPAFPPSMKNREPPAEPEP